MNGFDAFKSLFVTTPFTKSLLTKRLPSEGRVDRDSNQK